MIFVFDIDGTLLDDDERLSEENRKAVLEVSRNHAVILASGRMLRSILKFSRENFGVEFPTIAYNGAMVYTPDRGIVWRDDIPPGVAANVLRTLRNRSVHRQAYVDDELIVEEENEFIESYARHSGVGYRVVGDLVSLVERTGSTKILAIGDPKLLDELSADLRSEFSELDIFKSFPTYLDFVKKGVSKARALKILSEIMGFDLRDVVAFGDNDNDVSLLEEVGFGVAMENATPRTLEVADYVAPSNNDSGVARVVRFILDGIIDPLSGKNT